MKYSLEIGTLRELRILGVGIKMPSEKNRRLKPDGRISGLKILTRTNKMLLRIASVKFEPQINIKI